MLKILPFLVFLVFTLACEQQNATITKEQPCFSDLIDTPLDYYPAQRKGVSDKTYRIATKALESTYIAIKNDDSTFTYMDHMNLFRAFAALKEPKKKVTNQLLLAQEKNRQLSAEVFILATKKESLLSYFSSTQFDSMIIEFNNIVKSAKQIPFDLENYSKRGGFDKKLVQLMENLRNRDQKYRKSKELNFVKQELLDNQNIISIDSLYKQYGKYIGKSEVGENLSFVMWAVIQHSDLVHQEFYLPIVQQAVINNELKKGPFMMLVDRVYSRKHGYQIYGSQSGISYGSDEQIRNVKNKYLLD